MDQRVKWSNPGKEVRPSLTPPCGSYLVREPSGHPRLQSPTLLYLHISLMSRVFTIGPGDRVSIPSRVISKTQKWYLMPPCLTLSIIRYGSRVKWINPGNGVASFPTPQCSGYWKGSFWINLNCGRQLLLTVTNFQNNGKIWISCVDKALLSDGKNCSSKAMAL